MINYSKIRNIDEESSELDLCDAEIIRNGILFGEEDCQRW